MDAERSDVTVLGKLRPHRIGESTGLADLLEQDARRTTAEDVVEHGQGVAVLAGRTVGPPTHSEVRELHRAFEEHVRCHDAAG